MKEEQPSYLDENLTERDKKGGQTRLPQPNEESRITERDLYPGEKSRADQADLYPGEKKGIDQDFQRPDEFGDGDRRS